MLQKNTKPLQLDLASIFLQVKNRGKYFQAFAPIKKANHPLKGCFMSILPY